jgi:hypothetical protein
MSIVSTDKGRRQDCNQIPKYEICQNNDKPYSNHKQQKLQRSSKARNSSFSIKNFMLIIISQYNIEYKNNSVTNTNNYKYDINKKNIIL